MASYHYSRRYPSSNRLLARQSGVLAPNTTQDLCPTFYLIYHCVNVCAHLPVN